MISVQFVSPLMGHSPKTWDPEKPGDLERMREWFTEKLNAGYRAFAFFPGEKVGHLIQEFSEEAEKIILSAGQIGRVKMVPKGYGG